MELKPSNVPSGPYFGSPLGSSRLEKLVDAMRAWLVEFGDDDWNTPVPFALVESVVNSHVEEISGDIPALVEANRNEFNDEIDMMIRDGNGLLLTSSGYVIGQRLREEFFAQLV